MSFEFSFYHKVL